MSLVVDVDDDDDNGGENPHAILEHERRFRQV